MARRNLLVAVVGTWLVLAGSALGQEFRGAITGRVTDPSGAVIPGARVIAESVATGAKSETVSNPDGQYRLPYLPSGTYRLIAEASGFKRYVREGITVRVQDLLGVDIALEVGGVTETVSVTAEAPLLETSTASSGQVIDQRRITELPLSGRTPLSLAHLSFGVIPNAIPFFQRPFDNAGPSDFSVGGTPRRNNGLLIDGVPDMTTDRRVAFNPPVDAVQEFKVMTTGFDASYGFAMGGIVNLTTKSGTNNLHGNVYEFNQNSRLNANDFFLNRARQPKTVSRFNQWGANAGGPIWIPKVFHGRDRAFWFFAYEGIKDSFPEPVITTVPTEKERRGDFSDLLNLKTPILIYDPKSARLAGGNIVRNPFPDNKFPDPDKMINPVAKKLLQLYPLPNQAGQADGRNNYLAAASRSDTFDSEMGRFDFVLGSRQKLFYRGHHNHRIENRGNRFNNIATGNFLLRENWGMSADHVFTMQPTLLLNTRLGWTRFDEGNTRTSDGFDIGTLGFPAALAKSVTHGVLPRINVSPFNQIGPDNAGNFRPQDSFSGTTEASKVLGRHSIKFGANILVQRDSDFNPGNSTGVYDFRTDWTRQANNAAGASIGQELAAFLLGLPSNSGGFDLNTARTNQAISQAYYFHDDFRVKPNLTLNLGLRYERFGDVTERFNRSVRGFDSTSPSPIAAAAEAALAQNPVAGVPSFKLRGGLLFAGVGGNPREIFESQNALFSPRFGFAWQPLGRKRLVIRGGYGIHYAPNGVEGNNAPGFSQRTPFAASPDNGLTFLADLSNPFPSSLLQPPGSSLGLATNLGQTIRFRAVDQRPPYAQRWELDVQREFPGNILLEVGYVGNHMVRLRVDRQLNYIPRVFLSSSPVRDQTLINSLSAQFPNPMKGLVPGSIGGLNVSRFQLLFIMPEFVGVSGPLRQAAFDRNNPTGVVSEDEPAGGSYFHMLQIRVEKRFSKGLTFLANYMYSKLIEHASRLNADDPAPEKRVAEDDRPQRFVLSSVYELPFGRGKPLGGGVNPVVNRIIGGWQVGAVYSAQTGAPLNWGHDSSVTPIYFGGDLKVNNKNPECVFATCAVTDRTLFERQSANQPDFNVRAFPSRFGNLRRDGFNNWDINVIKNNRIGERFNLQYRLELFNALNHPSFDRPRTNPYTSDFGTITQMSNLPRNIQMALRLQF